MRTTRTVSVGDVIIGGGAPPVIQSMCTTDTGDFEKTIAQVEELTQAGCQLIRVAVPRASVLDSFEKLCARSPLPVIADIHFSADLACEAIACGASKVRINPGNIGSDADVERVIEAAKSAHIPLRIGVNGGSLAEEFKHGDAPLERRLADSVESFVRFFEERDFTDIVLSAKASSVPITIATYRLLAAETAYPLHIGVTESGTSFTGLVKSSVGIGTLLAEGIGDTLRVSLTANPVEEIRAAQEILMALDLARSHAELVSCPTCGRCQVDMIPLAQEVTARLGEVDPKLTIAVMGCVVNGPGEAKGADYGIACARGEGMVFARGKALRKVPEDQLVDALFDEIAKREPLV